MKRPDQEQLSRRERQIMDIIYRQERATTTEILEELPEAPGNSTVRSLLTILERKGHLRHEKSGKIFVYYPTVPRDAAGRTALQKLRDNFFDGSRDLMVAALLDLPPSAELSTELDNLTEKIERARRQSVPDGNKGRDDA
ncbi:MAG: BlaI/MecI/CopY family transcriptional regulator [bacterium]|nr:BlaI/MecI/CopY family transcriptional regulator [bacterium]